MKWLSQTTPVRKPARAIGLVRTFNFPFGHKKAQKAQVDQLTICAFCVRLLPLLLKVYAMSQSANESVHVSFSHTEKEYLAATRLYLWRSTELFTRLIVTYVLFSAALLLLVPLVLDYALPLSINFLLVILVGVAWFQGYVIDLPRRYFRGDPKFRDEYHLTLSDAGIEFQTQNMSSMIAWSFYTGVIENDRFYLMKYGKNIHSISILPKRAFTDSKQEVIFRQILRRNLDPTLKLSEGERQTQDYAPRSLEPPDWR